MVKFMFMYLVDRLINETTESNSVTSYLDLILSIRRDCQLYTFIITKVAISLSV